ncbi:MAG TPA: hypothetical protein VMM83_05610 [Longimicrobiales bacterium]|nr:hypothetical protein [Longimicrobiales bacterium]
MQRTIVLFLALAAGAAPASAQEWLVNRERFRYVGTRLTIDVTTEAAGRLQIIRGEPGIVRVAGRVPVGFAVSGLSSRDDRLTLGAAGAGPVDFMVVVPERVWISVRLPDRSRMEALGGHARHGTFEWGRPAAAPMPTADLLPEPPGDIGPGLFTTYSAALAPATVSLPDLAAVRTVTVRAGAVRFRIGTSRPLKLAAGDPHALEIRPAGEPLDIVIEVPAGTAEFTLTAPGGIALLIRGQSITTGCAPVTRQWLSGGREWVTFNPVDGRLDCGAEAVRHKG